jgi:hypothetical protein
MAKRAKDGDGAEGTSCGTKVTHWYARRIQVGGGEGAGETEGTRGSDR